MLDFLSEESWQDRSIMKSNHIWKTTLTYKILCLLGFKYPIEDYGDVSLWKVFKTVFYKLVSSSNN